MGNSHFYRFLVFDVVSAVQPPLTETTIVSKATNNRLTPNATLLFVFFILDLL